MSEDFDFNDDSRTGGLPDLTRRLLSLGIGAFFLTEDTIRRTVGEAKLPRDVAQQVVNGAQRRKDELFSFVKREITSMITDIDFSSELREFLRHHTVRVSAEIEFLPHPKPDSAAETEATSLVDRKSDADGSEAESEAPTTPPEADDLDPGFATSPASDDGACPEPPSVQIKIKVHSPDPDANPSS